MLHAPASGLDDDDRVAGSSGWRRDRRLAVPTIGYAQFLSVATHAPTWTLSQKDTIAFLPKLAGGREGAERFRRVVERSHIDKRHVETPLEQLESLRIGARSRVYEGRARALAEELGRRALQEADVDGKNVSAVVTVSCTGYMLPSIDAYIMP